MGKRKLTFYKYLRTQFNNLPEAIEWTKRWFQIWGQEIPDRPEFGSHTMRAMSRHVSHILEGYKNHPNRWKWYDTSYMETKYGTEIYWNMQSKLLKKNDKNN